MENIENQLSQLRLFGFKASWNATTGNKKVKRAIAQRRP